ncbi:MAG: two-component system, sensor histidine kinase PdtaS, partial [Frankiaceae bacterium]|nr:two-component system, sensor histidine kinase PdtaS [Frankiaceae bacterium]
MATLVDVLRRRTSLSPADADWLHLLVGEWQLLADLSFADLLLWVDDATRPGQYVVAAQLRPTTGPTAFSDDKVGTTVSPGERPKVAEAFTSGAFVRDPQPGGAPPLREETIPVRRDGRVLAVIGRYRNITYGRTSSALEQAYVRTADELAAMVADGLFPSPGGDADADANQRVGDGLIRLDALGRVEYASPNALSAYRRLGWAGDLTGERLADVTSSLVPERGPLSEPIAAIVEGRVTRSREVETSAAVVHLRAIPLRPGGTHVGALVLVRDVSELRSRDRQLLSKDATIREIHHRVKNNLQTVAALLRLQARRLDVPEARAALEESVRRVASIALVHETLSLAHEEAVDFDAIAAQIAGMVAEVSTTGARVATAFEGSFGVLPAEVATPLALVITELVQNAVEHAFAGASGEVMISAVRVEGGLRVVVADDGAGLPAGFVPEASPRLGLQIVRTLVVTELGGTIALHPREPRGTSVVLT